MIESEGKVPASRPSIGVVFPAGAPVELLPGFARRAEESGLEELWVVEDCFLSGGMTMAATALAATGELRVGIGLLPAPVRNPAIAAMEISTLANLHPGRLTVAIGHGAAEWMRQIAALPERRLAALEEVVTATRALLAGSTVSTEGTHVRLAEVALDRPPDPPPAVLVGTTGPKGLALAGRCTDGILLPEGCGPEFVAWALEQATQASPAAGAGAECAVYAWLRVEDDAETARSALVPSIEGWLASGLFPHPHRFAGADRPGFEAADLVDRLAVAGDAPACAKAIARFAEAGATRLALVPAGPDFERQLGRLATEVLPALSGVTGP
jgi:alkanesulfonate monooxygenase SsuD/methylene tetrahydromethanopterin reductase-like flavin-dependent oxidoreductase (luciferase family)